MARPIKLRELLTPHRDISFVPESEYRLSKEVVKLLSEEYEVIKLVDYENMNHQQTAKVLHVSRPTITRIYERARRKIAECLVEIKTIKLEGGNSEYLENWFKCEYCNSIFNIPDLKKFKSNCPVCLSSRVKTVQKN